MYVCMGVWVQMHVGAVDMHVCAHSSGRVDIIMDAACNETTLATTLIPTYECMHMNIYLLICVPSSSENAYIH